MGYDMSRYHPDVPEAQGPQRPQLGVPGGSPHPDTQLLPAPQTACAARGTEQRAIRPGVPGPGRCPGGGDSRRSPSPSRLSSKPRFSLIRKRPDGALPETAGVPRRAAQSRRRPGTCPGTGRPLPFPPMAPSPRGAATSGQWGRGGGGRAGERPRGVKLRRGCTTGQTGPEEGRARRARGPRSGRCGVDSSRRRWGWELGGGDPPGSGSTPLSTAQGGPGAVRSAWARPPRARAQPTARVTKERTKVPTS